MNWSVQVDTKVSETVSPSFLSKFKKRNQFHATFKKRKREKINADSSWQTQLVSETFREHEIDLRLSDIVSKYSKVFGKYGYY